MIVHGPLLALAEDDQIGIGAFLNVALVQVVEFGRVQAHFLHELHNGNMTFAHQLGDAKAQGCLQADDAAGRLGEGALFFFLAVGAWSVAMMSMVPSLMPSMSSYRSARVRSGGFIFARVPFRQHRILV